MHYYEILFIATDVKDRCTDSDKQLLLVKVESKKPLDSKSIGDFAKNIIDQNPDSFLTGVNYQVSYEEITADDYYDDLISDDEEEE